MGHLLKEGLKTLCGFNQWSYAVFWKFGCQNPKLLVWEECYCKSADVDASWISAEDNVHLLVNKMMMDSHFSIVGEGLVGRVAFTGNHQWILSQTYSGNSHPPEVVEEVCQQFSAGMQTVVVIPVLPHGVVQFGSCMTVMENLGFINDVTSLILQLGALLAPNYQAKEHAPSYEASSEVADAPDLFDSFDYVQNTSQNELQFNSTAFQASNSNPDGTRLHYYHREPRITLPVINGVAKAEVISSNSELWRNQDNSMYRPSSALGGQLLDEVNGLCNGGMSIGSEPNDMLHQVETSNSNSVDCFTSNSLLAYSSDSKLGHMDKKFGEISCQKEMGQNTIQAHDFPLPQFMAELIPGFVQDDVCVQPELGDDLFDILGADFKNKLYNGCMSNASAPKMQPLDGKNNLPPKKSLASLELHSASQGNSESGIFSSTGSDHLLEAVVSKIKPCSKQSMDDEISCRTTLTNTSSSSLPNASLPYGRFPVSDPLEYLAKAGAMSSCSLRMGSSKQESRSYSHGSSIAGKAKPSNSGHSTIPDEAGKASRKRLKPGESPRPRPKDRQMFQDRVKELREIVPNGEKCSLDALLERTIKHMLFLQSVSKHADMLKQTGESKVIDKDGSLLLKDKFEGGATWAYEVGSQSMVCPIIVEDLNQPRQMLVQMLCEERGMFLEIADSIRGLGLTILKGVMEMRNDKIWARFAVEANRDVTRMEIFMSLVRLLEQSSTGISNDNPTAQQFHRVASVPLGC